MPPASVTLDPVLDGVVNFRDFGAKPLAGGASIRPGVLYRSAHLAAASESDVETLQRLGINWIADLRRPLERQKLPTPPTLTGVAKMVEQKGEAKEEEAPHLAFLLEESASEETLSERMCAAYRAFPYDEALSGAYADYFTALANLTPGEAVLIHCHAGKDRTGLLAALTLEFLGAERSDIHADYLRTNADNRIERRLPEVAAGFERVHNVAPDLALLRVVMAAELRFLDAGLAAIAANDGSVRQYLERRLGVDEAKARRIRSNLVTS